MRLGPLAWDLLLGRFRYGDFVLHQSGLMPSLCRPGVKRRGVKEIPPHPTPPRRFRKSKVMAFPFHVMAFPVTGRSQLLGVPMAWRRRQAMAKWRLGRRKWRGPGGGRNGGPAPLSTPPTPLGHGLALPPGHGNAQ